MNRQFVAVGLGRLGTSMVSTFDPLGHEVLAIDKREGVIQPEREIGEQLARTIASPVLLDYVDLGVDGALIEAQVPRAWLDKSLSDLDLSQKMGLTVLAHKPKDGPGSLPHCDSVVHDVDVLVVGGFRKALDRYPYSSSPKVRRRFPACAR
jgi:Trk K+ transport system NAD-binding subunit